MFSHIKNANNNIIVNSSLQGSTWWVMFPESQQGSEVSQQYSLLS